MKKTILLFALAFIGPLVITGLVGCKKKTDTPAATTSSPTTTPTATTSTFKITSDATYTVPTGNFTTVTNTVNLQFAFGGANGTVNNGGNIYFPMSATTGTYTVKANYPNHGVGLLATEVAIDMASTSAHTVNIAQSGTCTLTVTGTTYKIVFTNLPSLTETTGLSDMISATLQN
jgi:hypothetical protein